MVTIRTKHNVAVALAAIITALSVVFIIAGFVIGLVNHGLSVGRKSYANVRGWIQDNMR